MSAIFDAAGAGVQAAGQLQAAEAKARAAEFNADVARRNAGIQETQTQADVERIGRENVLRTGAARAAAGASGGLTGSSLDILSSNAAQQGLDILNIKQQGLLRKEALLQGAQLDILEAKSSRTAGKFGAAATLLGGAAKIAGSYCQKMQQRTCYALQER